MENKQYEEAKNLYFQAGMSKTEIANAIGVNRRTILLWCAQGNWDKLKQSSRHMPALVAEKCYYLADNFASQLLQDASLPITHRDAKTLHLLALSIKKLKNRSTVNESMEMLNFFHEGLKRRNPKLASAVLPEMEEYLSSRKKHDVNDFLLEGFNDNGIMEFSSKEIEESHADNNDLEALEKETRITGNYDQALQNWQNL